MNYSDLDNYERKLVDGWEDVHKQGQLTLWIMLSLKDGPKHMAEIREFIDEYTNGKLSADDKSLYRALRRYHDTELVEFSSQPSVGGGPDRKVYRLSHVGRRVLDAFVKRNISSVYYTPKVRKLIERRF
jgi:PadR family transcriptional regulator, regulatory protein PadR